MFDVSVRLVVNTNFNGKFRLKMFEAHCNCFFIKSNIGLN